MAVTPTIEPGDGWDKPNALKTQDLSEPATVDELRALIESGFERVTLDPTIHILRANQELAGVKVPAFEPNPISSRSEQHAIRATAAAVRNWLDVHPSRHVLVWEALPSIAASVDFETAETIYAVQLAFIGL